MINVKKVFQKSLKVDSWDAFFFKKHICGSEFVKKKEGF